MKFICLLSVLFLFGCTTTTSVNMASVSKPLAATGKVINAAIKKHEQMKNDDATKLKSDFKKMEIILSVAKRDHEQTLTALALAEKKVSQVVKERDEARKDSLADKEAKWFWFKVAMASIISSVGLLAWNFRGLIVKLIAGAAIAGS